MKTSDIYRGSMSFVALQVIMVAVVLWKPELVMSGLGEQKKLDVENVNINITVPEAEEEPPPTFGLPASSPP
jgi:hypothetical protein